MTFIRNVEIAFTKVNEFTSAHIHQTWWNLCIVWGKIIIFTVNFWVCRLWLDRLLQTWTPPMSTCPHSKLGIAWSSTAHTVYKRIYSRMKLQVGFSFGKLSFITCICRFLYFSRTSCFTKFHMFKNLCRPITDGVATSVSRSRFVKKCLLLTLKKQVFYVTTFNLADLASIFHYMLNAGLLPCYVWRTGFFFLK